ncbi:MAG: TolC family protein, partial [Bacteroidota bacterium]
MKRVGLFSVLLSLALFTQAQVDTTQQVFRLDDLYQRMLLHHPITKQSNLITEIAQRELLIMRGGFDPKLEADYDTKELDGTFYYSYWDAALKIPAWIGEFKVGYELNEGDLISAENKTPSGGTWYAGISVPIGRNLLIDARRNALRQAQLLQEIAEADRIKEINKLFLEATKAYWDWYIAYNEYEFRQEAYRLAEVRFQGTKDRVYGGDVAPIDSVEAKINLQDRDISLRQARVDANNARLILSNYLWAEDNVPLEIPSDAQPQDFDIYNRFLDESALQQLVTFAQENHPELIKLNFKLKQLAIEQRFARDRLKPDVNVNYNFLTGNPIETSEFGGDYATNNYKFGFDFSFPLFLRKERGKSQQVQLKLNQTSFERTQTSRDIITEINTVYNEMRILQENVRQQEEMVENYQTLTEGEYIKFQNGESSVFLIN